MGMTVDRTPHERVSSRPIPDLAASPPLGPHSGRWQTSLTTIETKANFARPITKETGRVRAEARVVAQGRRIISTEAKVLSKDGKVLAHGTSTILVLSGTRLRRSR